jgi:hypothetical protein
MRRRSSPERREIQEHQRSYQTIIHAEPLLRNFDVEVQITRKGDPSGFPSSEEMLIGWSEISSFLQMNSEQHIKDFWGPRLKKDGIIFHKKARKPSGGGKVRRYCCAFPSAIIAWSIREALRRNKDERIRLAAGLNRLGERIRKKESKGGQERGNQGFNR